ncbi:sulfatase-like hydrolase/transferase [Halorientalis regularis]|uniref:Arylsulfatase A n=1 Tax=Halorientalis regularis TaxID=660518 RepID=A0A1G7T2N3_9EURY|nr:sulfatase-like hydrolase/transferase [Halorientalis regularis]SDG29596.1 Arylsulfatase A [Halorientalis regularis]
MSDRAENCILYVFDSLRYDAVAESDTETPAMDGLSENGVSLTNAWAQATWTYASSASIFSGLYPTAHGCHQYADSLTPEMPHLADRASKADITSACFSTTYGVSPERGFEQAFDEFYHFGTDGDPTKPGLMEKLNDALLPWVEDHADDRFFVVVWAMGTHHPYLTPDDVDEPMAPVESHPDRDGTARSMQERPRTQVDTVRRHYKRAVSHSDEKLGELVDVLRDNGCYDDTEMVVTADHGEVFDEHARMEFAHPLVKSVSSLLLPADTRRRLGLFEPSAFVGHQAIFPTDELIHVPLIYKPGSDRWTDLDVDDEALVELVDLLPTVRASLGLDVPDAVQGADMTSLLTDAPKRFVHSTTRIHGGPLTFQSVGDGEFKYIRKHLATSDFSRDHVERAIQSVINYLFGSRTLLLRDDSPVSDPAVEAELRTALRKHNEDSREVSFDGLRFEVDEDTKSALEDLGYH